MKKKILHIRYVIIDFCRQIDFVSSWLQQRQEYLGEDFPLDKVRKPFKPTKYAIRDYCIQF